MTDEQIETLVAALQRVRRGKTAHWFLVAKAADDAPALFLAKELVAAERSAKATRKTASDRRLASGTVTLHDDTVQFTVAAGAIKAKEVLKLLSSRLVKAHGSLGTAAPWLKRCEVVEAAPVGGGGLGIDRRQDATRASKVSKKSLEKLSDYSAFLDALDDWHREFGAGVDDMAKLGRARTLLDQIEAAAKRWMDGHARKLLEGSARKQRRKEILRVLDQVAEARRSLLRVKMEGHVVSDEERLALREIEQTWMTGRIEVETEEVETWKALSDQRLTEGVYGGGTPLGEPGTFGYAKLFVAGEGDPRLVGKFQTDHGRIRAPHDLEAELAWYERIGPHPNVARCLGLREMDGETCLMMEALEGGDLSSFITDGRWWVEQGHMSMEDYAGALQHVLRGAIRALQHMHAQGLSHKDIKPLNIMIDVVTGQGKVIDMGTVSETGTQHGTPGYRAPGGVERTGQEVDGYALGLSTFEGLEGELPDYRPELVEVSDEDAIAATEGLGPYRDLELDLDNFSEEDLVNVEESRKRLQRERAKRAFGPRGEDLYVVGEHRGSGGLVPWLGEAQAFVNRLTSPDPELRPTLQEMLELPFIDDSVLTEKQAKKVLKNLGKLRTDHPPPRRGA